VVSAEAWDVSLGGAATGADLGGSSKYSTRYYRKPVQKCQFRFESAHALSA